MALFDCPQCGQKVNVHADACRFCGRQLTDPITRFKAELARIDADWERERKEFFRDHLAWEHCREKGARLAWAVSIALALLLVVSIWLATVGHLKVDIETVVFGVCIVFVFAVVRLVAGVYLYWRASSRIATRQN
jgi:uncharacterized membrane protein YvbJ